LRFITLDEKIIVKDVVSPAILTERIEPCEMTTETCETQTESHATSNETPNETSETSSDPSEMLNETCEMPTEKKDGGIVPRLIDVSKIEIKPIEWLWRNKFHYGGLSILAGLAKQGKSMLTAHMAAVVTQGSKWCDGETCEQGSVLFFAGEDSPEEYARRLKANGADLTKIRILDGATLFSDDSSEGEEIGITLARLDVLEAAIDVTEKETGMPVRMVVIDPISNYWGTVRENNNAEVRSVLHPMQQFFQKRKTVPILIQHLRKTGDANAQLRVTGSIGIVGVARNLWGVYIDPNDPATKQSEKERVLTPIESNVCIDPMAVSFLIVPPDGKIEVVDTGFIKTGNDFEAAMHQSKGKQGRPATESPEAQAWLQDFLNDGARQRNEVYEHGKAKGFSEATIWRAGEKLGVKQEGGHRGSPSVWSLPPVSDGQSAD
jgi:hypothetical protein